MGISDRPYAGTWKLNAKKVVQQTPDVLVYLQGDLTLPGCSKCNSRIDIQKFLTQVDVDAGTEPTSGSASFTLALPTHHHSSLARDARLILRPGLEVHIYQRGYFAVKGLYSNLEQPAGNLAAGPLGSNASTQQKIQPKATQYTSSPEGNPYVQAMIKLQPDWDKIPKGKQDNILKTAAALQTIGQYASGIYGEPATVTTSPNGGYCPAGTPGSTHVQGSKHESGLAADIYITVGGKKLTNEDTAAIIYRLKKDGVLPVGGAGRYVKVKRKDGAPVGSSNKNDYTVTGVWNNGSGPPHVDVSGDNRQWTYGYDAETGAKVNRVTVDGEPPRGVNFGLPAAYRQAGDNLPDPEGLVGVAGQPANLSQMKTDQGSFPKTGEADVATRTEDQMGSPTLSDQGMGGYDIENILAYPYYHVFHGVVSNVSMVYDAGVQTFTVTCVSMLQLWQYLPVSINASIFGDRPENSKNHSSMMGHNFTGKHPYAIMYSLYEDIAGAGAGVSWALSQQTNVDAKFAGDSLYSSFQKYWERRFNTSQIKLRMHGATGALLNQFRANLLGRKTSSDDITDSLKKRFNAVEGTPNNAQGKSLGMNSFNRKVMTSLVSAKVGPKAKSTQAKGDFDLNMAELMAFTTKIGQIGQFQLFESTYETKMNIAQEVCKVTGFEFYQDVDGDYVFKPPFYNLDTSDAKVYRIEDIDIISLNVEEKEPQGTYIVAKGNFFQNTEDHGVENEFGVAGTYIDYRLVAQFGWRLLTFESSYLTDKNSVFFMAINYMDLQNAHTHTASLSIPLRPEIRPGYPIYIVSLDCYYYVSSMAHSFSMGGRCTTSLTLTAKRAKFFAPGDPRKKGIEAIDLGNLSLPEKPLGILDPAGRPRLSGFPNVVMALDPNMINPMFFISGSSIDMIKTRRGLLKLIEAAVQRNVLTEDRENPGVYTVKMDESGAKVTFFFDILATKEIPKGAIDIKKVASEWVDATKKKESDDQIKAQLLACERRIEGVQEAIRNSPNDIRTKELQAQLEGSYSVKVVPNPAKKPSEATKGGKPLGFAQAAPVKKEKLKRTGLLAERNRLKALLGDTSTSDDLVGDNPQLKAFLDVMRKLGAAYRTTSGQSNMPNMASTANLLDILSDKKANLGNGSLPGAYRYYSASHPDPTQQGQREPHFDGWARASSEAASTKNPLLLPEWKKTPIRSYLPSDKVTLPSGLKTKPEAQFADVEPVWGIRVLNHNPTTDGEILPTSEIRELTWAIGTFKHPVESGSTLRANHKGRIASYRGGFQKEARDYVANVGEGVTISEILDPWLESINNRIQNSINNIKDDPTIAADMMSSGMIPVFQALPAPSFVAFRSFPFPTNVPMTNYAFSDTVQTGLPSFFGASKTATLYGEDGAWSAIADVYANQVFTSFTSTFRLWQAEVLNRVAAAGSEGNAIIEKSEKIRVMFYDGLNIGKAVPTDRTSLTFETNSGGNIYSAVFPVSDARGYQVIGSMRYGRDIDIEPNGVFDVLHKQDPLHMLDSSLVAKIVDGLTKNGMSIDKQTQREVIKQLRNGMSDQQLIDLHLLSKKDGATSLELSFMNWYANTGRDFVHKIPVNNAAYSLADLSFVANKGVCTCKAAEAAVILEAAGMTGFLEVSAPGDTVPVGTSGTTVDNITPWLQGAVEQSALQWQMTQDSIRGVALDSGSPVVKSFQNMTSALKK